MVSDPEFHGFWRVTIRFAVVEPDTDVRQRPPRRRIDRDRSWRWHVRVVGPHHSVEQGARAPRLRSPAQQIHKRWLHRRDRRPTSTTTRLPTIGHNRRRGRARVRFTLCSAVANTARNSKDLYRITINHSTDYE